MKIIVQDQLLNSKSLTNHTISHYLPGGHVSHNMVSFITWLLCSFVVHIHAKTWYAVALWSIIIKGNSLLSLCHLIFSSLIFFLQKNKPLQISRERQICGGRENNDIQYSLNNETVQHELADNACCSVLCFVQLIFLTYSMNQSPTATVFIFLRVLMSVWLCCYKWMFM